MSRLGPILLLASSLAAAPAAAAGPEDGSEPGELRVYETATVQARPLARATAAVTILEREEILALGATSVTELIRYIPGLDVTASGPRGGFATAQIRGGDPNFTLVMVDGVPLNDITDQVGGAVNLNSLSVRDIERIEVVRGPLSSIYGSTGLAGAINIITRRGRGTPQVSLDVAAGDDAVGQAHLGYGRGGERADHFVSAWWEHEEDRVAEDRFEQVGVQGNARLPVGRGELRLTGRIASWETEDYPDASGGPVYGTGEIRKSDHEELSAGIEWWLGAAERRQKIYALAYRHDLERTSPVIPPGPSGFVPASVEDTVFSSWRAGWAMPRIEAGPVKIGFGAEVELQDGDSTATFALPMPFDDGSFAIDRYLGGAYVEMLAERGPVLFEVSARVDVPEGFDTELSPRAGVRYQAPNGATRLRASVGRAFKLPSFFALANPFVGNPDLEPEIVVGADAGVDHAFRAARLDTSLTLFWNRFEDLVDFDFDTLRNVNESVESRGVELAATWRPTDELDLRANLTRQDVSREDSDEPLRHRPDWVGGLRFEWRVVPHASWELDGQWVSERHDEQIPTGPGVVAGYQLYGSTFRYTVGRAWELRARVDNLADKDYETFIGFPGSGRSFLVGLRRGG